MRTRLRDVLELLIDHRGRTPRKLGGAFAPSGIPVLSAKNVKEGRLVLGDDLRYVSADMWDRWMPKKLRVGDVLLTSEAPLGEVAFLDSDQDYCLGQRLFALRVDARVLESRFLYYLLRGREAQLALRARESGTTAQGIRQAELLRVELEVPPLAEQRAIVAVLEPLDDKIDLNREINRTLEAMAQALFQSWFVDFDPVVAKAAGRQPFGMTPEVAALFPDRFVDSVQGRIPSDWHYSTVGEEYSLTMGQSPPSSTYNQRGEGVPFYQGRTDFGFRFPSRRVYCSAPTRFAEPHDALVSVRAPVGDVNMAAERCAVGRGLAAVRHRSGSYSFTYYQTRSLAADFAVFEGEGILFGAITKGGFRSLEVICPPPRLIDAFDEMAKPLDNLIDALSTQTTELAEVRDMLLPKLLSGEVRIRTAARLAEAVL